MKTTIVTEGRGEFSAFKTMFKSLETSDGALAPRILHIACQPDGPIKGIAKACEPAMRQASARKIDLFVLVIDRELQQLNPGTLAKNLKSALEKSSPGTFCIEVVYKDRTFENWLVSDLDALRSQPARFAVSDAIVRQVEPNKADRVQALDILKAATQGKQYDKIADGKKIADRLDVMAAARNSRSFRHMLHVLGHVAYLDQSKYPASMS
ncbi:DUF4276 family protein [Brevibacterium aurantiacum]|uniref:DUF4276 family protein n=1 Tax=Brevibacterium aurantiacum TaxID=273384 RepID=A0A556CKK7_BREAU|nr:DUF4276 family protein [Brevibacterium aurantiacum]TSI17972.1 DUF4276 family protein [Brevibacterium aurantiacum]